MKRILQALSVLVMAVMLMGCLAAGVNVYETPQPDKTLSPLPEKETLEEPLSDGALKAGDNYGILIPYLGAVETDKDGTRLPLYGLAALDGTTVTDPLYSDVRRLGDFLLLQSVGYTRDAFRLTTDAFEVTAAAADGSWVMDATDWYTWLLLGNRLAVAKNDGSVLILSTEGATLAEFPRSALQEYLGEDYQWGGRRSDNSAGGELVYAGSSLLSVCFYDEDAPDFWRYDVFLDMDTGAVMGSAPVGWTPENGWGDWEETPELPGYRYPCQLNDWANGEIYYCAEREDADGQCDLLNADGNVLLNDCFMCTPLQCEPVVAGGMLGTLQDDTFRYVDIDSGETVFSFPLLQSAA